MGHRVTVNSPSLSGPRAARRRAVLIVAGKPRPRELRLPKAGGCVIWGNEDGSETTLTSDRGSPPDADASERRLWPRAAVAWDFFARSSTQTISYALKPGGAKGTILLE